MFYIAWKTNFRIFQIKDPLHFKLIHESTKKISRQWVHASRLKPACPRDDQITPGFTIPDDEDLSKPLEPKPIPPHQVTAIQSDISDHALHGDTMNSDCKQSNAHNAADTHIIDTSLSKSHSISKILAKKQDLEGIWYYRVSYVKLPK